MPLADLPEAENPYEVPHAPIVLRLQSLGLNVLSGAIRSASLKKGIGYRAIAPGIELLDADRAKQALTPRAARLMARQGDAPQQQLPHDTLLERAINFVRIDVGLPLDKQRLPVFLSTRRTVDDNGQKATELALIVGNGDFIEKKQLPFVDATTTALETQLALPITGELPKGLHVPFGILFAPYKQTDFAAPLLSHFLPDVMSVSGIEFGETTV
jgi:hypothetical protein